MTRTAAIAIGAKPGGVLSYYRRLKLSAFLGEASFAVMINDHVIDEENGAVDQDGWEARRVNLPTISSDQITLKFAVRASSQMNYSPRAEAWIDDIVIS